MKKAFALLTALILLLALAACGGSGSGTGAGDSGVISGENATHETDAPTIAGLDLGGFSGEPGGAAVLKEPTLGWWSIKTNTGIPTFVCELTNDNGSTVDFELTATYYLKGEVVGASEGLYATGVGPGQRVMIFDTWEIPEAADRVELKYSYILGSYYDSVPSKVVGEDAHDGVLDLAFAVDGDFTQLDTAVAFFSGETLVAIWQQSFFPGDELTCSCEALEAFDSYTVYSNAY